MKYILAQVPSVLPPILIGILFYIYRHSILLANQTPYGVIISLISNQLVIGVLRFICVLGMRGLQTIVNLLTNLKMVFVTLLTNLQLEFKTTIVPFVVPIILTILIAFVSWWLCIYGTEDPGFEMEEPVVKKRDIRQRSRSG